MGGGLSNERNVARPKPGAGVRLWGWGSSELRRMRSWAGVEKTAKLKGVFWKDQLSGAQDSRFPRTVPGAWGRLGCVRTKCG